MGEELVCNECDMKFDTQEELDEHHKVHHEQAT